MKKNYLDLLDELRSIAQLGLNYSKNPYDIVNYNRLLQLAVDNYSDFTGLPTEEIKQRFCKELGYVIFNADGEILLERRSDDHLQAFSINFRKICKFYS